MRRRHPLYAAIQLNSTQLAPAGRRYAAVEAALQAAKRANEVAVAAEALAKRAKEAAEMALKDAEEASRRSNQALGKLFLRPPGRPPKDSDRDAVDSRYKKRKTD